MADMSLNAETIRAAIRLAMEESLDLLVERAAAILERGGIRVDAAPQPRPNAPKRSKKTLDITLELILAKLAASKIADPYFNLGTKRPTSGASLSMQKSKTFYSNGQLRVCHDKNKDFSKLLAELGVGADDRVVFDKAPSEKKASPVKSEKKTSPVKLEPEPKVAPPAKPELPQKVAPPAKPELPAKPQKVAKSALLHSEEVESALVPHSEEVEEVEVVEEPDFVDGARADLDDLFGDDPEPEAEDVEITRDLFRAYTLARRELMKDEGDAPDEAIAERIGTTVDHVAEMAHNRAYYKEQWPAKKQRKHKATVGQ